MSFLVNSYLLENLWTPTQLGSSLALWLDAADTATVMLNGSTVSQWSDKSGNGRNATQAVTTNQPTFVIDGLNAKPVLAFDGLNDFMSTGNLAAAFPSAGALFIVVTVDSDDAYTVYNTGAGDERWRWDGNGLSYMSTFRSSRIEGYSLMPTSGSHIYSVVSGQSVWEMWGNGTSLGGPVSGQFSSRAVHTIGSGGSGDPLKGSISEIVLSSSLPNTDTRQRLEGYLAHKWGLAGNLPIDHPYKATPPTV